MKSPWFYVALLLVMGGLNLGSQAWGQGKAWDNTPRYRPPVGSTMPSALNYFRNDSGVLDPYNTFVAPQQQLQQSLRGLDTNLRTLSQRENADYRATSRALGQLRESPAAATGVSGGFMNFSHYYSKQARR